MRNVFVSVFLLVALASFAAAFGPISFSANYDLTAPNMKNGGGFKGTTKYSWTLAAWSLQLDKHTWSSLQTYSNGATGCTQDCKAKKFCTYNLDLNIGDTFNIADWIYYENDPKNPIDFSACDTQFYYQDPTNPADWHLVDFNAKPPVAVTVTAAEADNVVGTGNHGDGAYRIYMKDSCGTDDHMTIRVSSKAIVSDVAGVGSGDVGCAANIGRYGYDVGSCGCQKYKLDTLMPQFFYEATFGAYGPTDRTDDINGVQCKHYPQAAGSVSVTTDLWVSAADDNTPCRVRFADGRVYTFTSVVFNNVAASDFVAPTACSCSRAIDTAIILDRSSNITPEEFAAEKTFATDLAKSFTISGQSTQVSVGTFNSGFSSTSRLYSGTGINAVTSSIKSASCCADANVTGVCCNTLSNISAAIIGGTNLLSGNGARSTADKTLVIVTEGFNNTDAEIAAAVAAARARIPGINIFVVANDKIVFSDVVQVTGGVESNVIPVTWPQFTGESVELLSSRICMSKTSACGATCCGMCDCDQCLAPDFCDQEGCQTSKSNGRCCATSTPVCVVPDKCTLWKCTNDSCVTTPKTCQADNVCFTYACANGICQPTALPPPAPANACQRYECSTTGGFSWKLITTPCTGSDPCLDYTCDPVSGCLATKKNPLPLECTPISQCNCTPSDRCYDGACVNLECAFTAKNCNDSNACTADTCTGGACVHTQMNCDDGNVCTLDSCANGVCVHTENPCDDGNKCTIDTCTTSGGCQHEAITCDDSSMCTTDSCDPASGRCVFTNITCNDNIACTNDTCHPFKGCIHNPITCASTGQCVLDFCQATNETVDAYACTTRTVPECTPDEVIGAAAAGAAVGAAAIAGIIVAIVVCVGAASGASYAMYQKMGDGSVNSTTNNPLYHDDKKKGQNPLYRSTY